MCTNGRQRDGSFTLAQTKELLEVVGIEPPRRAKTIADLQPHLDQLRDAARAGNVTVNPKTAIAKVVLAIYLGAPPDQYQVSIGADARATEFLAWQIERVEAQYDSAPQGPAQPEQPPALT